MVPTSILCVVLFMTYNVLAEPVLHKQSQDSRLSRFMRDTGLIRLKYQNDDVCQEGNNTQCLPDGITSAPTSLVDCENGQCVCNDCFMINDSTGRCRVCSDYSYRSNLNECGTDNRQSQKTAFLLSLFLASTGAANFYIGRNDLAGGQLFILLLTFALSYAMCCLPICLACCLDKDNVKGSVAYICSMLIIVLVSVASSLIILAWWIADLIIFITNQRLSGSGCELNPTL